MRTKKIDGGTATYNDSQTIKDAVFAKIIAWFIQHQVSCGESIIQRDGPSIDAPNLLAEILDDIIEFDIEDDN